MKYITVPRGNISLKKLSEQLEIPPESIVKLNKINPNLKLQQGMKIKVPTTFEEIKASLRLR